MVPKQTITVLGNPSGTVLGCLNSSGAWTPRTAVTGGAWAHAPPRKSGSFFLVFQICFFVLSFSTVFDLLLFSGSATESEAGGFVPSGRQASVEGGGSVKISFGPLVRSEKAEDEGAAGSFLLRIDLPASRPLVWTALLLYGLVEADGSAERGEERDGSSGCFENEQKNGKKMMASGRGFVMGLDYGRLSLVEGEEKNQTGGFGGGCLAGVQKCKKNSFNRRLIQKTYNGIKSPSVLPALSARIYGDKSAFYDCAFLGVQDTLWDVNGRHHFSNCYIEGSVDFIYGAGQSFYEGCIINVTSEGFITAQGKEFPKDTNGFVFSHCYVTGVKGAKTYLGRAYRGYSTVIYNDTYLSDVVQPEGWFAWDYMGHEGNITYVEANCKGPGANTLNRVKWEKKLTKQQLNGFSKSSFIDQDGWLAKLPL
ncbi:hypothetical protein NC651_010213 [Populus alba x Populus x berolinensis]|nr:hypothetical protein NC651_010213 [Populus alba x Populus x berolinensis]